MTKEGPARPPQATLAAWLVMLAGGGVVLASYFALRNLQSLDGQDAVSDALGRAPWDQLDLGLGTATRLIRAATLVAAAAATASVFLGREALNRSRSARVALTVLAPVLFLTGRTSTVIGFLTAVAVSAVVVMWLQPSRDWFAGVQRPIVPPLPPPTPPALPPPPGLTPPPGVPGPPQLPSGWPRPLPAALPAQQRPAAVTWAAVLTWAGSAMTALVMLAVVLVLAFDSHDVFVELHRQQPDLATRGVTDAQIRAGCYVMAALLLAWCAGASLVALQLWRRRRWARVTLGLSAGVAAGLLAAATFGLVLLVVPLGGCIATLVLLRRPEVDRWL